MGTEVATATFQHSEPLFVATNKYKPTEDTPTPKQGCCTHSLKLIPTSDSSQAAKRSMHLPDSIAVAHLDILNFNCKILHLLQCNKMEVRHTIESH